MKRFGWLAASALLATACGASASTGTPDNSPPHPSTSSPAGVAPHHRPLHAIHHVTPSAGQSPSVVAAGSSAPPASGPGHSHASTQMHSGGSSSAGPQPVVPGTYTYDQSGTQTVAGFTSAFQPRGTLRVEPATATGRQTSHMTVDSKQPPSTQTMLFNRHGMFLLSEVMQFNFAGKHTITCRFHPGIPYPPWPVRVGKSVHAHASCGQISVTATGRVTGQRTASIGGTTLTVFVIKTTLTTSGQARSTSSDTAWFAPALRLSVHDVGTTKGSFGPFGFSSHFTRTLASTRPS